MKRIAGLIIVVFAVILYGQSISFDFVLDDMAVTYDNGVVTKGIKGIPTLLATDYWYGRNDSLRVPEYRPASPVLFATEWQFFKDNPHYYHVVNIALYALICWLVFLLLCRLFANQNLLFPFVCALLYAAHPIHTEVVDNIKSCDELLCFLFGLLSVFCALKACNKGKEGTILFLFLAAISYFCCLLSKETGIVFLLIVPLILYLFTDAGIKRTAIVLGVFAFAALLFLSLRSVVLEGIQFDDDFTPLNNSLWAAPDWSSQKATAFYVMLRYISLLLFPHPLVYDYSESTISLIKAASPWAIAAFLIYLAMGLYAVITLIVSKRKETASPYQYLLPFAILFYLITLAPVSNLFVVIGSTMAERFLFMPSLGFTIVLTWLLFNITGTMRNSQFTIYNSRYLLFLVVLLTGFYSVLTLSRSRNWKDADTLFLHDAKISVRSARVLYNYGWALFYDKFMPEKNDTLKQKYFAQSISALQQCLKNYSRYPEANICMGLVYLYNNDVADAVKNFDIDLNTYIPDRNLFNKLEIYYAKSGIYDTAIIRFTLRTLKKYPDYPNARLFLGKIYMTYNDVNEALYNFEYAYNKTRTPNFLLYDNLGILYTKTGQYGRAISILDSAIKYFPGQAEAYNNEAFALLQVHNIDGAMACARKAIELAPNFARAYMNAGCAYANKGDLTHALENLKKASVLDPLDPDVLYYLGRVYQDKGDAITGRQLIDKSERLRAANEKVTKI